MEPHNTPQKCPTCGEPLQPNWKLCPVCETHLNRPRCPQCGIEVKEHWRRCPECAAALFCYTCGRRLEPGETRCPLCREQPPGADDPQESFSEPHTAMTFVWVPAGSFDMGDTFAEGLEDELPVHEVRLDGFYLARFPVTQAQWMRLMTVNPSRFRGEQMPVEQVGWQDVLLFIERLNAVAEGKWRFALPSEAQWEYAARSAGRRERYAGGEDVAALAWYEENSDGHPHPVGEKMPNGLGLFDMSGNVWEWTRDIYCADAYRRLGGLNPVCSDTGDEQVIRGGGWNLDAWSARCARRLGYARNYCGPALGFRPAALTWQLSLSGSEAEAAASGEGR